MPAIILTGARRDEMREAKWSEFDFEKRIWTLPAERSKNGREHLVPLSQAALDILESLPRIGKSALLFTTTGATPISGLSRAKERLDAVVLAKLRKADLGYVFGPWTPHDLRRTFSTGLQRLGSPVEVIEECLNHKSGTRSGVAGVYARHRYLAEKTTAFEAWARHVDGLMNGRMSSGEIVIQFAGMPA